MCDGRRLTLPAAMVALTLLTGCGKAPAHGTANSLIIGADSTLWAQVQDSVQAALEPTIYTVRQEKAFRVTQLDPGVPEWEDLQDFVQVMVIGDQDDPWVAEALGELDGDGSPEPPAILQVHDVWALNQQVTILLLSDGGAAGEVLALLDDLQALMDRQYRDWVRNKMFLTGRDTALADTLRDQGRFSLLVPRVYQWRRQDSVFVFRNDNPDPSELIRQVAVAWRTLPPGPIEREYVSGWRESLAAEHYDPGQVVAEEDLRGSPATHRDQQAYVLQGTWTNPPELGWPAAGPFMTRAVTCPDQDRVYLLDGWLYAPGRDKYEYMIQLETILDSFRCGA